MTAQIHYPNGGSYVRKGVRDNHARRGTRLEEDINDSNTFYRNIRKALIYKKPTPVQITKVDYPKRGKARITEAFYRTPSTTDYNGIYRGQYVDFEAKETKNKTSFPKYLVQPHQISHLKEVDFHGGIGFFIIRFTHHGKTFLVDAMDLIERIENTTASSIPYSWFESQGILIQEGLYPRLNYLKAVDQKYLKGDADGKIKNLSDQGKVTE